jgi:putative membrane protein insertion efficiency factor
VRDEVERKSGSAAASFDGRRCRDTAVGGINYVGAVLRAFFPSPGVAGAPTCKYHPSCSEYARLAVRKHGVVRGLLLAAGRVLRCNPWSRGGVDHP